MTTIILIFYFAHTRFSTFYDVFSGTIHSIKKEKKNRR
jgi:hypothetical protein